MGTKKYQIFISSTLRDLVDERQLAMKAILDLDHIPAGMEAFPAIDMEQFEYIKKVIDECDYYLLIIGARYGSVDKEGVSFTEREFDYARSTGKTVIALIHSDIENLPMKNFDADPSLKVKLDAFREKVKTGRMVRYWDNRDALIAAIMQAIVRAISMYPAAGWIRGDAAASAEVMQQLIQLRTAYDELIEKHNALLIENSTKLDDLASLDDNFVVRYVYTKNESEKSAKLQITWGEILKIIGPKLYGPSAASWIRDGIAQYIFELDREYYNISIKGMDADQIKIHFAAIGIMKIDVVTSNSGGMQEYISLTEKGKSGLLNLMAVRAGSDKTSVENS